MFSSELLYYAICTALYAACGCVLLSVVMFSDSFILPVETHPHLQACTEKNSGLEHRHATSFSLLSAPVIHRAHTYTYRHTDIDQTHTNICIHIDIHTYIHKYTHIHTYTHTDKI